MPKDLPGEEAELDEAIDLTKQVAQKGLAKRRSEVQQIDEQMSENFVAAEDEKLKVLEHEMVEKIMPFAATRSEMEELELRIDKKIDDLKALLLRAKAQGKARIQVKEEDKEARLKEIYGDTLKFG